MRINRSIIILSWVALVASVSKIELSKLHHRHSKHFKDNLVKTPEKAAPEVNTENSQYKPIPSEIRPKESEYITFKDFKSEMLYRELSPGEMRIIYNALDKNHNNKVSSDEWSSFYKLFVESFESCNVDKDNYLLDVNEVGKCLQKPEFEPFQVAYKSMEEIAPHVVEMLDKPRSNKINFADFLFLRRVSLAWKKCASGKVITPLQLPCALRITSPESKVERGDATHVFELGKLLNRGRNKNSAFLDLLSFLNVAHLFYYFSEFERPMFDLPFMGLVISKAQLHRVIQNQILPSEMGADVVEAVFNYVKPGSQDIDKITFSEFGVFMFTLRLYAKYAIKKFQKFYMDPKGFNSAIGDVAFDPFTLQMIDTFETPTLETVKHQLNENYRSNISNEEEFLISFLQKKSHGKKGRYWREDTKTETKESTTTTTTTTTTEDKTSSKKSEKKEEKKEDKKEEKNEEKKEEKKEYKDEFSSKSNRLIIYNSFGLMFNSEHKGINELSYIDFLRFYKLSICFNNLAGYDGLANSNEINSGFKTCFPSMPFYSSETEDVQTVFLNYPDDSVLVCGQRNQY